MTTLCINTRYKIMTLLGRWDPNFPFDIQIGFGPRRDWNHETIDEIDARWVKKQHDLFDKMGVPSTELQLQEFLQTLSEEQRQQFANYDKFRGSFITGANYSLLPWGRQHARLYVNDRQDR